MLGYAKDRVRGRISAGSGLWSLERGAVRPWLTDGSKVGSSALAPLISYPVHGPISWRALKCDSPRGYWRVAGSYDMVGVACETALPHRSVKRSVILLVLGDVQRMGCGHC